MSLAPELEEQVQSLAARYGTPRRALADIPGPVFSPLTKRDRLGEVCMVVRRRSGGLIVARKIFYPRGVYRLLTGGIMPSEPILTALLRETDEETSLRVEVRRFLAVVEYRIAPDELLPFATFAFLLDEQGGTLGPRDAKERLESFREVQPAELPAFAAGLEQISDENDPEIEGNWRAWGHFRAVIHREVHAALAAASS